MGKRRGHLAARTSWLHIVGIFGSAALNKTGVFVFPIEIP